MSLVKWVVIAILCIAIVCIPISCALTFYREFIPQWKDQKVVDAPNRVSRLVMQDMENTVLTPYETRLLLEQKVSGPLNSQKVIAVLKDALAKDLGVKWINGRTLEITIPNGTTILEQHSITFIDQAGKTEDLECRFKIEETERK